MVPSYYWPEFPDKTAEEDDSVPGLADVPDPIDLAFVVGSIRAHAPELSADLDEAITVWLAQTRGDSERRSRLQALRELLNLSPYEPDSRD